MFVDKLGKKWYKGNLHMHTSLSDGDLTPQEAMDLYIENGYDFISITDHWTYYYDETYKDLTVLAGDEYHVGKVVTDGLVHILGIGCETKPQVKWANNPTIREVVDAIHEGKGLAILAHPAWSLNDPDSIIRIGDYDGLEIYNSISGEPLNCSGRAYSGVIVDMLAARGYDYPLFAHDDAHFYQYYDKCRSYILVNAESNSKEDLMKAIREKKFYSSQGPTFDIVEMRDGILHIECSPCQFVSVVSDCVWSRKRNITGENITSFDYEPVERDKYLRVEIRDKDGNWAWSQIIRLDK